MRKLHLIFLLTALSTSANAQIFIRTDYIGRSEHKDMDNHKTGGKGDAFVFSGVVNVPLEAKPTDDGRLKAFGLTLSSSYTAYGNNEVMQTLSPDLIFNNRLGVIYITPLKKRWSIMASVGAGIYAPHTRIGKTRFDEVLFDGAIMFVWHLRRNLDVGAGLAVNSSFGYPMGFPAFYVNWNAGKKYFVNIRMVDGINVAGGINFNEHFTLGIGMEMNGALALQTIEGKSMMFSTSTAMCALQPEIRINSNISVPLRAGVAAYRDGYYEERTLRAFFRGMKREYDPHFNPAPYFSAGINITF